MKRSEMVKKLETYLDNLGTVSWNNLAKQVLHFIESQSVYHIEHWDSEEAPKSLPIEVQVKNLVQEHMSWDEYRTNQWYHQLNPLLGGLTPNDMVCQGKQDKLLKFINNQLEENTQPKELYDYTVDTIGESNEERIEKINQWMDEHKGLFQDLAEQEELDKERPKLPQKNAVKRLRDRYNARRQTMMPSKDGAKKALKTLNEGRKKK